MGAEGGAFEVFASGVNSTGIADLTAYQSQPTASRSSFTVPASASAPAFAASPRLVPPGTYVALTGSNLPHSAAISFILNGATLGTGKTTKTGVLMPKQLKIPVGSVFGPAAIEANATSGTVAEAPIYVSNSWVSQGNGPLNQNTEPNDRVFTNDLPITNALTQAWLFDTPAALKNSPVIANGMAFLADSSGTVTSVFLKSGMQDWQVTPDNGAIVNVTPAIDESVTNGVLVIGDQSGSLIGLNAQDGATLWTTPLGGGAITGAPVIAGGVIYVGTQSGTLFAVSESSGTVIWHGVYGVIDAPAAVDTTAGLVIVADQSGKLTALSLSAGSVQWQFTAPGPIATSPMIFNGFVYFGSANDFYSVSESTGSQSWVTKTAGTITSSPALYGATVLVGDSLGNQYSFVPSTGQAVILKNYNKSVITGMVTAVTFTLVQTKSGLLSADKNPKGGSSAGAWIERLGSTITGQPILDNGAIYAVTANGLFCFTVLPGSTPE